MPSAYEMEELHALHGRRGRQDASRSTRVDDGAVRRASSSRRTSEPHVGDVSYFRMLLGHGAQRAGGVQRHARRRREAGAPVASRRARSASRCRCCTPATSAASRSCATRTRTTRCRRASIRSACRRSTSPSRSCTFAVHADGARTTRRSCSRGCTGCTTRIRRSRRTTTPRRTRRSIAGWASGTSRSRWRGSSGSTAWRRSSRGRSIAYRETITAKARRAGAAQETDRADAASSATAGSACSRLPRGEGYQFVDEIVGGVDPVASSFPRSTGASRKRQRAACSPAIRWWTSRSSCSTARTTRWTRTKCRSRWPAFSAFKTVAPKCRPVLLEPLDEIEITTPDQYLGDVMGDISARRGQHPRHRTVGDGAGTRGARGRAAGGAAPLRDGSATR